MTFTYTYRSSDGQRHTAEIEAESRDAAFARVRHELGVKPIKVMAAGDFTAETQRRRGHKAVHYFLLIASIALIGSVVWFVSGRLAATSTPADGYRQETREAFLKLVERAGALEDRCLAELKLLKLDRLHDYAWIAQEKDISQLYHEFEKAQSIIDYTKQQAKELFKDLYRQFPSTSANERADAQKRYGKLMEALDAEEERQQAAHLALMLLDDHRAVWRTERGRIVFSDPKVEEDFRFYTMPTDGSAARWKRDFGQKGDTTP